MDYKIVRKEAFEVIGKVYRIFYGDEKHNQRLAKLWEQCNFDGTTDKIIKLNSSEKLLGICMDFEEVKQEFSYMIAIQDINDVKDTEFEKREIPSADWAILESVGPMPDTLINLWSKVFNEWYPETGFQHGNAPDIEVYYPGDPSAKDYKCEIWTPIVKM
ncbi:GyrI-like domain-containing protein [Candidatus Clostridium stratigraminis]|uniref:GyrI-like domain-containing protein n=1 Tax=Candidatus Clostridium stratigraminis TaxID=3381661 RepID=A0ABW8T3G5_9CLOT